MKILLVAINSKYIHSNLAVFSLKQNARECKDDVEICEYTINHRKEDIVQGIYKLKPEVIAFSCYIWNIEYVKDVARDLKKILPDTRFFAGGPEVSYEPVSFLEENDAFDLVMVGEGERTFYEVAKGTSFDKVKGLCYRKEDGSISFTGNQEPMNMDDLVFPYDDFEIQKNHILYYESIRGCPFSCSYCLSSIEKTVRIKSLEKTKAEIKKFIDAKVVQVKFVDRTFNCNHEHAYEIWKFIHENDNGMTNFHFEIAGDLLREEDFSLFKKFRPGLVQFEIGVQSTNMHTIEEIRRVMDIEELAYNVGKIQENGNIHVHLDLIAGLPYEDFESFKKSFNDVFKMHSNQLQLGFLKVLSGSYMKEMSDNYDIKHSDKPPYEVFSTKWISYDEILELKKVEEMLEDYYNSGQFTMTMAYLEGKFENPYDIFYKLAKFYEDSNLVGLKHSRLSRYEYLWKFAKEEFGEDDIIKELIKYDMFAREYVKNMPYYLEDRDKQLKEQIRLYLDEAEFTCELYTNKNTRQLYNMIYIDRFTIDFELLMKEKRVEKKTDYVLMFDYQQRSPLTNDALISVIDKF